MDLNEYLSIIGDPNDDETDPSVDSDQEQSSQLPISSATAADHSVTPTVFPDLLLDSGVFHHFLCIFYPKRTDKKGYTHTHIHTPH